MVNPILFSFHIHIFESPPFPFRTEYSNLVHMVHIEKTYCTSALLRFFFNKLHIILRIGGNCCINNKLCHLTKKYKTSKVNKIHERALRIVCKDSGNDFVNNVNSSVTTHKRNLQLLMIEILKTKNDLNPTFMKDNFAELSIYSL